MTGWRAVRTVPSMTAAVFDLNRHAGFIHWHFIELSVPNVIAIVLMGIVFVVAILAPFPGAHGGGGAS
jgi:hypothetical protein